VFVSSCCCDWVCKMEKKFLIKARVYPADFSMIRPLVSAWGDKDGNPAYATKIFIEKSNAEAEVVTYQDIGDLDLKNIVKTDVSMILDTHSVFHAHGYELEMLSLHEKDTDRFVQFDVTEPIFDPEEYPAPLTMETKLSASIVLSDNYLRFALTSYRLAICNPDETLFFCFRAIEGIRDGVCIRHGMEIEGKDKVEDKFRWLKLSEVMQISYSEDDYKIMRSKAMNIRHGSIVPSPWEERKFALRLARDIILKYIDLYGSQEDNDLASS
jgi:hypothetical protein